MADVAPLTTHPAKFSDEILPVLNRLVVKEAKRRQFFEPGLGGITVVDPFAGVGRIHQLARQFGRRGGFTINTLGLEIEPEWAACHQRTLCTDSLRWMAQHPYVPFLDGVDLSAHALGEDKNGVDCWCTSPCYGNRFADHHEAKDGSTRHSYRHDLGRMPSVGSAAVMPYGPDYWEFHAMAYRLMLDCARPGTPLILNVSDFVKGKTVVPAATWHMGAALGAGWLPDRHTRTVRVPTKRMGYGENYDARVPFEMVFQFRAPGAS